MDYYLLPEEIWREIFLSLRYKEVKSLSMISLQFSKLCKDENIIQKLKMRGFPRKSGCCERHDVHKFVGYYHGDILPSLYDLLLVASYDFNIKEFNRLQNLVLDELYNTGVNLVRGDLILYEKNSNNNGVYIFDGLNIIELDYKVKTDGFLPDEFTVINDNVPINYWNVGIKNSQEFWFDHKLVKKQCIDNIKYINMNNIDYVFTNFNYNDINYSIIDYCNNEDINIKLNKFLLLFNGNNNLLIDNIITNGPLYDEITKLIPNSKIIRIKLDNWRNFTVCF